MPHHERHHGLEDERQREDRPENHRQAGEQLGAREAQGDGGPDDGPRPLRQRAEGADPRVERPGDRERDPDEEGEEEARQVRGLQRRAHDGEHDDRGGEEQHRESEVAGPRDRVAQRIGGELAEQHDGREDQERQSGPTPCHPGRPAGERRPGARGARRIAGEAIRQGYRPRRRGRRERAGVERSAPSPSVPPGTLAPPSAAPTRGAP